MHTTSELLKRGTAVSVIMLQTACLVQAQGLGDGVKAKIQESLEASRPTAIRALAALPRLLTPTSLRFVGLSSEGISNAEIGEPVAVFRVPTAALVRIANASDAYAILGEPEQVLYPIRVKNDTLSSISVLKYGKIWKVGGIGGTELIQRLTHTRDAFVRKDVFTFVVEVAHLDLYLIARGSSTSYDLISIESNPALHQKAGGIQPALSGFQDIVTAFGLR